MPASLRPLRHRDFALVFGAGFVSNAGSWMQTIGVGVYIEAETHQASWVGLAALAAFLPIGLLGPVGGAVSDRVNRKRFLVVANLVEGVVAAALAVLIATGAASAGLVVGVVFLGGCVAALRLPFWQAMVPDLVPKEDLMAASALGSAQYNLGRVLGPTIAGVTITVWGIQWVFVVNAVSFLALVAAMAFIRLPPHVAPADSDGLWSRIRDGARVARAEPACRSAIGLMSLTALLIAPFIALIAARAAQLSDVRTEEAVARIASFLTTAQGVGAVIGAIAIAEIAARIGRQRVIVTNMALTAVAVIVYANAPSVVSATAAMAVLGGIYIGILSGLGTTVQLRAPAEYRGRVLSLYLVSLGAVYPVGGVIHGFLADRIGLAATTTGSALVMLGVIAYLRLLRPHVFSNLRDPEPDVVEPQPETANEAASEQGLPQVASGG